MAIAPMAKRSHANKKIGNMATSGLAKATYVPTNAMLLARDR
jgi:hypothetical protein